MLPSIKPKRTNQLSPFFKRGEAFLLALDVLREGHRTRYGPWKLQPPWLVKKSRIKANRSGAPL